MYRYVSLYYNIYLSFYMYLRLLMSLPSLFNITLRLWPLKKNIYNKYENCFKIQYNIPIIM